MMGKKFYVWFCAVFAAIGGITFGYDVGAINGVKDMVGFRQTFNLSNTDVNDSVSCETDLEASSTLGLIVSIFSIGAIPGALVAGGVLIDTTGRKASVIIGAIIYTVGGALQTGSVHIWMLYLGRFITGFGVGVILTVAPVYLAELAPKNLRGRFLAIMSLYVMGGALLALLVNLGATRATFGWRISLAVTVLVGLVYSIGMLFLPKSPRWLVKKHRDTEAEEVLAKVYGEESKQTVQQELREMQGAITGEHTFMTVLKAFLKWTVIHKVLIGVTLQVFNRFSGQVIILYYSVTIFCNIGLLPYITSAVIGVMNFLGTVVSLFVIDKLGRKTLLLLGILGMFGSILLASTLLVAFRVENGGSKAVGYIVVVALCFFVFSFSASVSPVSWGVNSEIHSITVRGFAVSLSTLSFWVSNLIVAQLTPIMLASPLQTFGTFYILAGVNIAGFFFTLLVLPETKGESLERLGVLFAKPWLERVDLFYYLRCGCLWCGRKSRYTVRQEIDMVPLHSNGVFANPVEEELEEELAEKDQVVDHNGSGAIQSTPKLMFHSDSIYSELDPEMTKVLDREQ